MEVTVRHTYPLTPSAYWQTLYGHRPFIQALYTEGLGGESLRILDWNEEDGGAYSRTLSFMPKMNAPKAVKKVLGGAFRVEERGRHDPVAGTWTFEYISGSMARKIDVQGKQTALDHGEGCEIVSTLRVKVAILGVGRLVEKTIISQFQVDMDAQARFIRRWIAEGRSA